MKSFRSLLCAVLLAGSCVPAFAGVKQVVSKGYNRVLEYSTISVAAYPFIEHVYNGVPKAGWFYTYSVPFTEYLRSLSREQLLEYATNTSMPYAKHAALLLLGGYTAKKAVGYVFN